MRISDWSSDVCSSDLHLLYGLGGLGSGLAAATALGALPGVAQAAMSGLQGPLPLSSPMAARSSVPAPAAWFRMLRPFPDLDPPAAVLEPLPLPVARPAPLPSEARRVWKEGVGP